MNETLWLSNSKLMEIPDWISEMTWITELYLSNNNISEIKNLDSLTNLRLLVLGGNKLKRIENIAGLVNLKFLDIQGNQISILENLDELVELECLIARNNNISSMKGINNLKKLRTLRLGHNHIKYIDRLQTNALETLDLSNNLIENIEEIKALSRLSNLDLSTNRIKSIPSLELPKLKILNLRANQISKIASFESFELLQSLNLDNNKISDVDNLKSLINESNIREIFMYGTLENSLKIPFELFGSSADHNCYKTLKGYFNSLVKGTIEKKEMSVILIGNSTAGKSSLSSFLQKKIFPSDENYSTHGINCTIWVPDKILLKKFSQLKILSDVQFYLWDFGGQEYYHATHRLFFSPKAIYLVLWEVKTNLQKFIELSIKIKFGNIIQEKRVMVEVFPFTYWVSAVRNLVGNVDETPILLVQNKIDETGNSRTVLHNTDFLTNNNCEAFQISIKRASEKLSEEDYDFDYFLDHFFKIAAKQVTEFHYGAIWEKIKILLQNKRNENLWTLSTYLTNLRMIDENITEDIAISYATSLRALGLVFFYPIPETNVLSDYIIINPGWITENIYSILDYSVLRNNGEFTEKHVEKKVGKEYKIIFIELMKRFELIFENMETNVFVAPQYLPNDLIDARKKNELRDFFDEFRKPNFSLRFKDFFPRSIILRFLVGYAEHAIGKYYWKNGIAFMMQKRSILLLCDNSKKEFKIFTQGNDNFIQKIILQDLIVLCNNISELELSVDNKNYVSYYDLHKEYNLRNSFVKSDKGKIISIDQFRHFFERSKSNNEPEEVKLNKIKLFISYSHKDKNIKEIFEEKYLKAIQNYYDENIEIFSDSQIKTGEVWQSKIENEIRSAQIIIFFISSEFLSSSFIKEVEIKIAMEGYKEKKKIIYPILIEQVPNKLLPFSDLQYVIGKKPLREWKPQNKAWVKIQEKLIETIDDFKKNDIIKYFI